LQFIERRNNIAPTHRFETERVCVKRQKQIIAIGGGGFASEPDNPRLELYLLAQTRKANPRVCFIPTATGDAPVYVAKFYAAFSKYRCRLTHLPLFERTPKLRGLLLAQDLIYVGGGNTKSMLAVWREWDLPKYLREAWNAGTVLSGVSAGAICWFARESRIPGQGIWRRWIV
jgi:peptidase E